MNVDAAWRKNKDQMQTVEFANANVSADCCACCI
jgi:hypothetical protein